LRFHLVGPGRPPAGNHAHRLDLPRLSLDLQEFAADKTPDLTLEIIIGIADVYPMTTG
jgi:hypothetical protein